MIKQNCHGDSFKTPLDVVLKLKANKDCKEQPDMIRDAKRIVWYGRPASDEFREKVLKFDEDISYSVSGSGSESNSASGSSNIESKSISIPNRIKREPTPKKALPPPLLEYAPKLPPKRLDEYGGLEDFGDLYGNLPSIHKNDLGSLYEGLPAAPNKTPSWVCILEKVTPPKMAGGGSPQRNEIIARLEGFVGKEVLAESFINRLTDDELQQILADALVAAEIKE